MAWTVLTTAVFDEWLGSLTPDQQDALIARKDMLAEFGPHLGRPDVDTISGSRHHNMNELRASALRVVFVWKGFREGKRF